MSPFRLGDGQQLEAEFLERPNRFLVRLCLSGGRPIDAFLPNPGRLQELLLPGARMWVQKRPPLIDAGPASSSSTSTPRLLYTALAVERDGVPVCLDTRVSPRIVGYLIERGLVPPLRGARVVRYEVPSGRSRFDMLVEHEREEVLVEVKSVTLYGNGVAMFPDAVTERGRRHFLELAAHSAIGQRVMVIFVVHTSCARWFMPDYHTDFEFARTMLATRDRVETLPLSIGWLQDLTLSDDVRILQVPWDFLTREVSDRGAYLLVLELSRSRQIVVGGLGLIRFQPGYYVYVGSAMQALDARIDRHLRRRKIMRWHIDYLRSAADKVKALPIRTSHDIEQPLAHDLRGVLASGPAGFGASDSDEPTHLFHSPTDPLLDRRFLDVLQTFRMRPPPAQSLGTQE